MKTKPVKTYRIMPFGAHKGKSITKVPRDYLEWMVANVKHKGDKRVKRLLCDAKLILAGKQPKPVMLRQVASGSPKGFRADAEYSDREERPVPARVEPRVKAETWDDWICDALKLTRQALAQDPVSEWPQDDLGFLLSLGDSELSEDDKSRVLAIRSAYANQSRVFS